MIFGLLRGDFNATRFIKEHRGNPSLREDSNRFNAIINQFSLADCHIGGRCFTKSNGRIYPNMAKLDGFLVYAPWDAKFPISFVKGLASDVFNHVPICLITNNSFVVLRRYKFEKV